MTYTVLKNYTGSLHWEGEFNSLREARAYCKTMTKGKEKVTFPSRNESTFCFEIYRGEVEIDGDDAYPIEGTDSYYV